MRGRQSGFNTMTTVASPLSPRSRAMEVITAMLGPCDSSRRLMECGGAVVANLLVALEKRFDIGLDVDEVLPNGTVGVLLNLVELRAEAAEAAAKVGRLYHWDDERVRRGRPLCAPRPQLAAANPEPDANLAPPPWPASYPEPRPEIAVPSDEAWAQAAKLYARERARRALFLLLALGCAAAGVGGLVGWAMAAGLA